MFASDPVGMKPSASALRQINLLRGWPSTQLLPAKQLMQGAQNVLSETYDSSSVQNGNAESSTPPSRPIDYNSLSLAEKAMVYGPDPGHLPLRMALGKWLQSFYGPATSRAFPSAFQQKTNDPGQYENIVKATSSDAAELQEEEKHLTLYIFPPVNYIRYIRGKGTSITVYDPVDPAHAYWRHEDVKNYGDSQVPEGFSIEVINARVKITKESEAEEQPKYDIPSERITLTGGASQSLGVIMAVLTDPTYTRKIWIVTPAYFLAFNIFRDAGFAAQGKLAAVPELALKSDQSQTHATRGPDVAWLRRAMAQCELDWQKNRGASSPQLKPHPLYKKIYKHLIYLVPSFSNPSSITSTLEVRKDLVRCAREFDALIVCDDVYDMLQWPAITNPSAVEKQKDLDIAPLPRLVDVDRFLDRNTSAATAETHTYGNVVSNGTFSKIIGPGCRVGWVEGEPDLAFALSKAGTSTSGGSPGHMASTFVCDMMERGTLQQHVRDVLRPGYAERWAVLVRAVQDELNPLGVTMPALHGSHDEADGNNVMSQTPRAGGYFLWLTLPNGLSAAEVTRKCIEDENLIVAGGRLFQVPGITGDENSFDKSIRLCFAWEALPELKEGVSRLARVLRKMMAEPSSSKDEEDNSRKDGNAMLDRFA